MGLDMYLTKRYYVKNWEHQPVEWNVRAELREKDDPQRVKSPLAVIDKDKIEAIVVEVGYWRKANQIHNWFVENCQDGVDECQQTFVSREQLAALLETVNEVLDAAPDVEKALDLLPPADGFFFGGTDIDEYYWQDLEYTQKLLTEELAREESGGAIASYYYQSSW